MVKTNIVRRSFTAKVFHISDTDTTTRCGLSLPPDVPTGYFYADPALGYSICAKCGGQPAIDVIVAERDAAARAAKIAEDAASEARKVRYALRQTLKAEKVLPKFSQIGDLQPDGLAHVLTIFEGGETFTFRIISLAAGVTK